MPNKGNFKKFPLLAFLSYFIKYFIFKYLPLRFMKNSLQLYDSLGIHIFFVFICKKLPRQSQVLTHDKLIFCILLLCGFAILLGSHNY